jgi:D-lactate dehydrogenase (cytochrome)
MPSRHLSRARPPRGQALAPELLNEPADRARFTEDAAHFPGGFAQAVALPRSESEIAALLRTGTPVLAVGAQSSLTGGATPRGEIVISTARLDALDLGGTRARAGAGVTLAALQARLDTSGRWYPPVPTYTGATCGGVVATNAAGAATFRYGTTRDWVESLTVVLADGEVLDLERGEVVAHPDGFFDIETSGGVRRIPVPRLPLPDVPKHSAGYRLAPGMDLVDLFIGSEGTLGIVTEVGLRVVAKPPARVLGLVPVRTEPSATALVATLRRASLERHLVLAAVEHADARSLALLREDGEDARHHAELPRWAGALLFIEIELDRPLSRAGAWRALEAALADEGASGPLAGFCECLRVHDVLDEAELVLPGDDRRAADVLALREAVPTAVNRRVGVAQRTLDARIAKTAGDVIVPFDRFDEMMRHCRQAFEARGLDYAVWGHISDGNIHPNVIPGCYEDVMRGADALMELGRAVIALGGSPLAEHGVGRHPTKQRLLELLHGADGIEAMRRVKRALDPGWQLSPGVLLTVNTAPG